MKKKNKIKLSVADLQVTSFSATLRKDQTKELIGGSDVYNTDNCPDTTIPGYCGFGGESDTSQTSCAAACRPSDYPGCWSTYPCGELP